MSNSSYIPLDELCSIYEVESTLLYSLQDSGLIQITTIKEVQLIHYDDLAALEKLLRLQRDLNLAPEALDVVLNLLNRIENLQQQLIASQNRLRLYE